MFEACVTAIPKSPERHSGREPEPYAASVRLAGVPFPAPGVLQTVQNRVRAARAVRVCMVCRVLWLRALERRLGASMLLMVGGRPKTAGLTVLRLMLADRNPLCHHDMPVPTE